MNRAGQEPLSTLKRDGAESSCSGTPLWEVRSDSVRIGNAPTGFADNAALIMILAGILGMMGFGLVFLAHLERSFSSSDSVAYAKLARTISEEGLLSFDAAPGTPELHRTPGYPLFLILAKPWISFRHLQFLLVLQALLVLATAWVLMDTAWSRTGRFPDRQCLWAGALLLCNPIVLLYTFQVLTETLFAFLLALALWMLARGLHGKREAPLLISGLILGAAILVRPIGLTLIPAGAVTCAMAARCGRTDGQGHHAVRRAPREQPGTSFPEASPLPGCAAGMLRHAIPWVVGAMLLPGLWMLHNGVAHGYWGISKTGVSFVGSAYGEEYLGAGVQKRGSSPYDKGDLTARASLAATAQSIARHPGAFARALVWGLAKTLLGPGEWSMRNLLLGELGSRPGTGPITARSVAQSERGLLFHTRAISDPERPLPRSLTAWLLILWSLAVTGATYLVAFRGAFVGLRRRDAVAAFCLLAIVLLDVGSCGYQANARFRVPMVPFLAVLAAVPRQSGPQSSDEDPSQTSPSTTQP